MASSNEASLHLLSIDLASAPAGVRNLLELRASDVEHWLLRAAAVSAPLAIVCTPSSLDLYSTEAARHAALRPLLESLKSLAGTLPGFAGVRTLEARGPEVVRHLLRKAAGLASSEPGESQLTQIEAASARAAAAGTLSDALDTLFRLAITTAQRSLDETELSAPTSTRASRQLEALGAERIVEEELIAFRLAAANDAAPRASSPAPRAPLSSKRSWLPAFSASEAGSGVRLQLRAIASDLTTLRARV